MEDEELIEGPYILQPPEGIALVNAENLPNAYLAVNRGTAATITTSTTAAGIKPITFEFEDAGLNKKYSLAKPEDIDEIFS